MASDRGGGRDGSPLTLKLGDLGIARGEEAEHLTIAGDQLGSLLYISERQRKNPSSAGSRDDFYSLALVMYEIGTRQRVHTRNPSLTYLQPPRVPRSLCKLIDLAMQDRSDWLEIRDEFCHLIDLEAEKLNTAYAGSRLLPELIVRSEMREFEIAVSALLEQPKEDATPMSSLLRRVANVIAASFRETAEQIADTGVRVGIEDELDSDGVLWMGVEFLELHREAMDRAGLLEQFVERSSVWLRLQEHNDGVTITELGSKRIPVDDSYMDNYETATFKSLDEVEVRTLRRIGQGLAIGLALGAIRWAVWLAEAEQEEIQKATLEK